MQTTNLKLKIFRGKSIIRFFEIKHKSVEKNDEIKGLTVIISDYSKYEKRTRGI